MNASRSRMSGWPAVRDPRPWAAFVWIAFLLAGGILVGLLPAPAAGAPLQPPDAGHWLGTDLLGRDFGWRMIAGGARTFLTAFGSAVLSILLGGLWGIAAGFAGGWIDRILSRWMDAALAVPALILGSGDPGRARPGGGGGDPRPGPGRRGDVRAFAARGSAPNPRPRIHAGGAHARRRKNPPGVSPSAAEYLRPAGRLRCPALRLGDGQRRIAHLPRLRRRAVGSRMGADAGGRAAWCSGRLPGRRLSWARRWRSPSWRFSKPANGGWRRIAGNSSGTVL